MVYHSFFIYITTALISFFSQNSQTLKIKNKRNFIPLPFCSFRFSFFLHVIRFSETSSPNVDVASPIFESRLEHFLLFRNINFFSDEGENVKWRKVGAARVSRSVQCFPHFLGLITDRAILLGHGLGYVCFWGLRMFKKFEPVHIFYLLIFFMKLLTKKNNIFYEVLFTYSYL